MGGRNKGGGKGGRNKGGGYDWRQHIQSSSDPQVNAKVRQFVEDFMKSSRQSIPLPGHVKGREKNSYKEYARQLGCALMKGADRSWELKKVSKEIDIFKSMWKIAEEWVREDGKDEKPGGGGGNDWNDWGSGDWNARTANGWVYSRSLLA